MIKLRIVKGSDSRFSGLDPFFGQVFLYPAAQFNPTGQTWQPLADIFETRDSFQITLEAPGLTAEDIEIQVHRNFVQVTGHRPHPKPVEPFRVLLTEIHCGGFSRGIQIPTPICPEETRASLDNGLLTVILVKDF